MQFQAQIENEAQVDTLAVRYFTAKRGIVRTKAFSSLAMYRRWEKSVTGKNYGIEEVKPTYIESPQTMPEDTKQEDLPPAKVGHHWKQNLMTRIWFQQADNTPRVCDPSTEAYWCM